jgi:hypothetical protein
MAEARSAIPASGCKLPKTQVGLNVSIVIADSYTKKPPLSEAGL